MSESRRIILVDQDGPLADWESELLRSWKQLYPELPWVELNNRRNPRAWQDYAELEMPVDKASIERRVKSIYESAGFYRNLPVVDGARGALHEMLDAGFDVRICTSPLSKFDHCVLEKYEWVQQHFGQRFVDRIIMCRQKVYARGDFLIDDLPDPTVGSELAPVWNHIVFDAPYNRGVRGKLRLGRWNDWQTIVSQGQANLA